MVVYDKPGYVQVRYQPADNIMVFDWTNFMVTLEEIQDLHGKALDAARKKLCWDFVAETSRVQNVLRQDVIEWWGTVWVPELVKAGLRSIVTVVPTKAISQLSTQSWQAKVVGPITMKNVATFAEAKAVIKELRRERH